MAAKLRLRLDPFGLLGKQPDEIEALVEEALSHPGQLNPEYLTSLLSRFQSEYRALEDCIVRMICPQ
jgi:hypothetical protein